MQRAILHGLLFIIASLPRLKAEEGGGVVPAQTSVQPDSAGAPIEVVNSKFIKDITIVFEKECRTHVIEVGQAASHWNPDAVNVRIGDYVEWRARGGVHGVVFRNWRAARRVLEIDEETSKPIQPRRGFPLTDQGTGVVTADSTEPTLLVRARIKDMPCGVSSVQFMCTNHGTGISGELRLQNDVDHVGIDVMSGSLLINRAEIKTPHDWYQAITKGLSIALDRPLPEDKSDSYVLFVRDVKLGADDAAVWNKRLSVAGKADDDNVESVLVSSQEGEQPNPVTNVWKWPFVKLGDPLETKGQQLRFFRVLVNCDSIPRDYNQETTMELLYGNRIMSRTILSQRWHWQVITNEDQVFPVIPARGVSEGVTSSLQLRLYRSTKGAPNGEEVPKTMELTIIANAGDDVTKVVRDGRADPIDDLRALRKEQSMLESKRKALGERKEELDCRKKEVKEEIDDPETATEDLVVLRNELKQITDRLSEVDGFLIEVQKNLRNIEVRINRLDGDLSKARYWSFRQ